MIHIFRNMQNMIKPKQVSLRVAPGLLRLIEQDIEENEEYLNRTEWVMDAIYKHLEYRTSIGAIRKDSVGGGGATLTHNAKIFHIFFYV